VDIADNNENHLEHEDMITRWCSKGNVDMDTLVLLHVDDRSTFSLSDFTRLLAYKCISQSTSRTCFGAVEASEYIDLPDATESGRPTSARKRWVWAKGILAWHPLTSRELMSSPLASVLRVP
jgi:hypothetical protein